MWAHQPLGADLGPGTASGLLRPQAHLAEAGLISVCVPTYNGERFLAEQLASILHSPLVTEVLVSDDGSTDGTRAVARGFGDARVRVMDGPRAGLVRNYEHLLGEAQGDLIFLADQDDVWLPQKVEVLTAALRTADLVVSDCVVVDKGLRILQPSFFAAQGSAAGLLKNLARNSYLGCCMAFRRRLLVHALPFPREVPMHDWWLGLVAEVFGTVRFVPTPLVLYRRHGDNASSTSARSSVPMLRRLAWRASIASALARRRLAAPAASTVDSLPPA